MSSAATLTVRRMEIPTYVLGPDCPYPPLMLRWEQGFYPYSAQIDIRTEKKPVQHRVVVLENEYVEAVILPDMGGRLYSLFDKIARQHTFMVSPSVKYQNISHRGAWIAGGIELNFGHRGHNVTTVSPISWHTRTEPDGSVSVYVGATVRPLDARWSVRYNLQPGRSVIDMNILTMAPQVLPGLMYWWSNSAVEVGEQSRFYYFGHQGHGGGLHSWPVTGGLDYQWYRNRVYGGDMFLGDPQRDYMGFYDFERHHGLAQIANRFLAPGQKYFTWGCDARGKVWDLLLSDSEQSYCEIQRGRLETQGVTEPIPPMSTDGWAESWMPINKTEGFGGLENDLVVSVTLEEAKGGNGQGQGAAVVRLLSVVPRHDLKVQAFHDEQLLDDWTIEQINPGLPAVQRVVLAKGQVCNRVKVTGPDNQLLMDWTEFQYKDEDWARQYKTYDDDKAGMEERFIEAERRRFESWPYFFGHALPLYEKILAQDPGHMGALRSMAEIDIWQGQFAKAEERIRKALARRSRDAGLQMLLGWALIYQNRPVEAVGAFMTASRYEADRKNGVCGAVSALLKSSNFAQAAHLASEMVESYPNDRWAMLMKGMTLRKIGRTAAAAEVIAELLRMDPLWSRAAAEALLLGLPAYLADDTRHLADDSVTAAGPYLELGLWDDAARILECDESDEPFSPAMRLAHLLYARHKLGDKTGVKTALRALREASTELAHPWSMASLIVLSDLAAEYPEESLVQLMLGNILISRKRIDDAKAAWKKALDLGLEDAIVLRNLAAVEAHQEQPEAALAYYRRAWKLGKGNVSLFCEFDRFLASQGLHKDREKIYQHLPSEAKGLSAVALHRVPQLLDMERYDEALQELATRTFLAGEGGESITRIFWLDALQGKAIDLLNKGQWRQAAEVLKKGFAYPRNLNVGRRTVHPAEAMLHYFLGLIAEEAGQMDQAHEHWKAAISEVHSDGEPAQAYGMLAWLAMGNWPKAMEIAHKFSRIEQGEAQPGDWIQWIYGQNCHKVGIGLAHLVKGRVTAAREVWQKVIDKEERDSRWIRQLLALSDELLARMNRGPGKTIEQVRQDVQKHVPRLTGPKSNAGPCAGGNGQCNCKAGSNGTGKAKGVKGSARKVRR